MCLFSYIMRTNQNNKIMQKKQTILKKFVDISQRYRYYKRKLVFISKLIDL